MAFNSYVFLFVFLPVALAGYYFLSRLKDPRPPIVWLVLASVIFFAAQSLNYLIPLALSIALNFGAGLLLTRGYTMPVQRSLLFFGIAANILVLGYYKYTNFFLGTINNVFGADIQLFSITLPLAISFFTLQQIAYLVDISRGERLGGGFWNYCLFITYFPKLLMGPIIRIKDMASNFASGFKPHVTASNLTVGLTTLAMGLFEKTVLGDFLGRYADASFAAAGSGSVNFFDAWTGALAYTFQIYFDFVGYCDMGIGIALMFGIRLPLNFYSPYKATGIIDFWRRWHITLSSFIRDYIYIPLGGNRRGYIRQVIYLLIAMTIAGLWHGAGWTFVIWGAIHGVYLAVNHGWRRLIVPGLPRFYATSRWITVLSTLITFVCVTIAWVFFRATSMSEAIVMLRSMSGMEGLHLQTVTLNTLGIFGGLLQSLGIVFDLTGPLKSFSIFSILLILVSLIICWFLPNVQEYMSKYRPALNKFAEKPSFPRFQWLRWQPTAISAVALAFIAVFAILAMGQVTKFIYMQF